MAAAAEPKRHDVIVVGGGLVGASLTLGLQAAGFDVCLLERGSSAPAFDPQQWDPRVYAIAPASARWLDELGIWAEAEATRSCAYQRMRVWETGPAQALNFGAPPGERQLGWIVENSLLHARVWARIASSATLDVELESMSVQGGQGQLIGADGRRWSAALIVAADGAQSTLRNWAGIAVQRSDYRQRAVVCHLQTEQAHQHTAWQRFTPSGPLALLPLADGRSSLVWSLPDARAQAVLEMDERQFCELLSRESQSALGQISAPSRRLSFPLQWQHAERYFSESLALVGDAAHVVHPLAGQGMNLGLADAELLVNMLRTARARSANWASRRLLARYSRARGAAAAEMLTLTHGLQRLYAGTAPALLPLRRMGLRAVNQWPLLKRQLISKAVGA